MRSFIIQVRLQIGSETEAQQRVSQCRTIVSPPARVALETESDMQVAAAALRLRSHTMHYDSAFTQTVQELV
jgi:hypothetical protein